MSVDRTDYIVFGYKMPYKITNEKGENIDTDSDVFLKYIEEWDNENFVLIQDGMNGKYSVFGYLLGRGNEYSGIDFLTVDWTSFKHDYDNYGVKEKMVDLFDCNELVLTEEPTILVFSHYF